MLLLLLLTVMRLLLHVIEYFAYALNMIIPILIRMRILLSLPATRIKYEYQHEYTNTQII
jgi:hypothetical protein